MEGADPFYAPLLPKTPLPTPPFFASPLALPSSSLSKSWDKKAIESGMLEAGGSERGSERATGIRPGKTLGKRERSQVLMPRTTSMASLPSAAKQGRQATGDQPHVPSSSLYACAVGMGAGGVALKKDSGDLAGVGTAAFLKACGVCGRCLGPGKDTYIYRGETAFCSQECREQRIESDGHMEQNCSLTSMKEAPSAPGAGGSDQSSNSGGETGNQCYY